MKTTAPDYILRSEVDRMIKDWQAGCANFPAIYNQGNVLRDRLAAISPTEPVIASLFSELAASPLGMDGWTVKPVRGVPVLEGGRRGTLAIGTFGTWKEFELVAALVNSLIAKASA